eukprot:CAMPEP_0194528216 /NCGR_PEP_ID=MMETSP0253-20130528/64554_1 /TAXON_ID=2966 /ORGANISM="Noctiluca scintillans" /LENGTH=127 /DNA_ID=CAMNT_0039373251 /DNA_START=42 /DNA_END=425 /DNA_ORIENTATION=-
MAKLNLLLCAALVFSSHAVLLVKSRSENAVREVVAQKRADQEEIRESERLGDLLTENGAQEATGGGERVGSLKKRVQAKLAAARVEDVDIAQAIMDEDVQPVAVSLHQVSSVKLRRRTREHSGKHEL